MCEGGDNTFCYDTAVIDWQVGQVKFGTFATYGVGDGIIHLFLRQRLIIGNVVDVTRGILMICTEHEAIDDISDVAERKCVVATPYQ